MAQLGKTIGSEVMAWGTAGIVVIIVSLILIKFKTSNPGDMTCNSGDWAYNSTSNLCHNITNTSQTTALNSVAQTTDTFVTALSEPKNWVAIAIIAMIGFGLLYYFHRRKT